MLPLAALALLFYYLMNVVAVRGAGNDLPDEPVDAIVVLGAAQYNGTPSPQLAARLDHALDLYEAGHAATVVVTGGKLPGDNYTEAEAERAYLEDRGVPSDAILDENQGRSTFESLDAAAEILRRESMSSVLLVTDPFHTLRTKLIAEEVGLEAYTSPTPSSVITGRTELKSELREALGVSVGRIIGFERLTRITG